MSKTLRCLATAIFVIACVVIGMMTHLAWVVLLSGIGCSFLLFLWSKGSIIKNVAMTLTSVFFCLMVAELVVLALTPSEQEGYSGTYTTTYFGEDRELGYGPNPGTYTVKKSFKDQLIYDEVYSISENSLRRIPDVDHSQGCTALFFGGSVTFGEGVGDKETMPYYFVQGSKEKFSAYNFGFHGYGPHQMLRTLETDRVRRIVDRPIDIVVYQGIEAHVDRVMGKATWDFFGPSYTMDDTGTLTYRGPFRGSLFRLINGALKESAFYRYVRNTLVRANSLNPSSVGLYLEVLKRVRQIVEGQYHAKFVVLFWDKGSGNALAPLIIEKLTVGDFYVIPVSRVIPDIQSNSRAYVLSPHDPHPNAKAHQIIGKYLAEQFMDSPCSSKDLEKI